MHYKDTMGSKTIWRIISILISNNFTRFIFWNILLPCSPLFGANEAFESNIILYQFWPSRTPRTYEPHGPLRFHVLQASCTLQTFWTFCSPSFSNFVLSEMGSLENNSWNYLRFWWRLRKNVKPKVWKQQ